MGSIIEMFSPKPSPAYIPETEESKRYHQVAETLYKQGIYGEDNAIATAEILGLKSPCDEK